jgi:hypothetical protein
VRIPEQCVKPSRLRDSVVVQEDQPLARGGLNPIVAGTGEPDVPLMAYDANVLLIARE